MAEKIIRLKFMKFLIFALLLGAGFSVCAQAEAATITVSPATASVLNKSSFSVTVYLNSADQSANAVSGALSFPTDKLEVTSVSRSGSVVNFWINEPSYSNTSGSVSFEGVILNPGYQGNGGKVFSVTFRAKAAGSASLRWSSGSVLANDGLGSNILKSMAGARVTIQDVTPNEENTEEKIAPAQPAEIKPATQTTISPATNSYGYKAPEIRSEAGDAGSWSRKKEQVFSWKLPSGVKGVKLLLDDNEVASPAISYVPAISKKKVADLDEGTWYLHASFIYSKGDGPVAHFPVNIDLTPPSSLEATIISDPRGLTDTQSLRLVAADSLSGIGRYEYSLDGGAWQPLSQVDGDIYRTGSVTNGQHGLAVRAYDKAGNYIEKALSFDVNLLARPEISKYTKRATANDKIVIGGKAKSGRQVAVHLEKADQEPLVYIVPVDSLKEFRLVLDRLGPGTYTVYAQALDPNGGKSLPSEEIKLNVSCSVDQFMIRMLIGTDTVNGAVGSDFCKLPLHHRSGDFIPYIFVILLSAIIVWPWYSLYRHRKRMGLPIISWESWPKRKKTFRRRF